MRYVLTMTLDKRPAGTDVSDVYRTSVLERLVDEGYVTVADDELAESDVDEEGDDESG